MQIHVDLGSVHANQDTCWMATTAMKVSNWHTIVGYISWVALFKYIDIIMILPTLKEDISYLYNNVCYFV